MVVYVFGNLDLENDSLPIKILPELQKRFPEIEFRAVDPNEEWEIPNVGAINNRPYRFNDEMIIIDTVVGIDRVTIFDDLKMFQPAPRVSLHDFDAHANLRYLQKLGKLKKVRIIGVPVSRDERMVLKELIEVIHKNFSRRRKMRLPDFDYSQEGYYFVTICTKDRKCLFGKVRDGEMVLNNIGKIVENEWRKTPEIRENVSLDVFTVMPNHLHGIIVIEKKLTSTKNVGAYCNTPLQSPSQTLGSIIRGFKSASATEIKKYFIENSKQGGAYCNTPLQYNIWQRNYYEHVIRNERSLSAIQNYIINNSLKWELDEENPKNFRNNKP